MPPTFDVSYMAGEQLTFGEGKDASSTYGSIKYAVLHQAPGSRYDLREQNKLTPVKDQGDCGSCWAFATYGSLESFLLPVEVWDFSENNLKNTHGFNWAHNRGGNHFISLAYLARWSGPVNETDDTYNASSGVSPSGLAIRKHVQDTLFIPDRANSTDNFNIKMAVWSYGAVYSTIYYESASYNLQNHTYYYNGTSSRANHAIDIVGWDDDYPASNFSSRPPGNGAFIVRNSWGTGWGESGYFYVSYYDRFIGKSNAVFTASPLDNFDRVYQYDPLGLVASYGGNDTAWLANVFNATASEQLSAVGLYALAPNTEFNISIYIDPGQGPINASGPVATVSGVYYIPGYHTVPIDPAVPLIAGHNFSVVARVHTPGYRYPVAIEYPYTGYSTAAKANSSESYYSGDGNAWSDMTALVTNANVCLKAYTKAGTPNAQALSNTIPASMVVGEAANVSVTMRNTGTMAWTAADGIALGAVGNATGDAAKFAATRLSLPAGVIVRPGEQYTWSFRMTAPAQGSYTAQYRMFSERYGWFGSTVSKAISVSAYRLDSSVVENSIPASMVGGLKYNVSITMKNTGNVNWTEAFQLGAVGNASGDAAKFAATRLSMSPVVTVRPGEKYTWNFTMTAPSAGSYNVSYRMINEDRGWFGATASRQVSVAAPVKNATVSSGNVPSSMATSTSYSVSITMKNTGNIPWNDSFRLVGTADASRFGATSFALAQGTTVQPGQSYAFRFNMTAPTAAGNYTVKYRMADGGSGLGETYTVSITVAAPLYNASIVSSSIPAQMLKGKVYDANVTVKNTGNTPWSEGDHVRLGAAEGGSAAIFSGSYILIEQGVVVLPGEQYTFRFTMNAPDQTGSYTVKYRMVKDSTWFGDTLSKTVAVKAALYQ